jgi:hypothetical protein
MGFVNPGAGLFAGLFAVLIALYLWERTRRRVDVPSLLLWRVIPEASARATRFRWDWLFVLQCLLLAALIAGLADPYLTARSNGAIAGRTVFVLDLSASMQAREGRTTRFEMARAAVRRRLDALGPEDEAMLVGAAHHPQIAAPFSHDRAALLHQLDTLEPFDTRANLDAALAIAQRAAAGDRPTSVELYTDTPREQLTAAWRDTIGITPIGETDDNVAIEGVQVFQGRFQDYREARAHVAVRNFAHRGVHGILTLALDDTVFSRRGFSLAPRSVGGFPIDALPGAGVLRASLDVDDALDADNRAFAYVRPVRPLRVRVMSDDPALRAALQHIASATPNLRFDFVGTTTPPATDPADVIVFDGVAPPPPTDVPSLYLNPPPTDGGPFVVRSQVGAVHLSDWNAQHPVLHGLRPELPFPIAAALDIDVPPWADSLLSARANGRDVALAFAGEHDGQRRAVLAFDLARDDLLSADHLDLLLFFLNLLDWLAPADDGVRVVQTGDVEIVDRLPIHPRYIMDPRQHEIALPPEASVAVDAAHAGEYRITADGTVVHVFANLADAAESDIGRPAAGGYVAARARPATAATPSPTAGGGRWLYAVAAALLLLEWAAGRRSA